MPQRTPSRRMYTRLLLFSLAGFALWALGRNRPEPHGQAPETAADTHGAYANDFEQTRTRERSSYSKRRLATSLTFATLFFAGAALSAGAGDTVAEMMEGSDAPAAAETTTAEAPAEEAPPAEAPPAPEPPAEEPAEAPAEEPAPAPAEEAPAEEPAAEGSAGEEAPADGGGEAPAEGEEPAEGDGEAGSEEPAEEPAEEEPAPEPKDDEPSGSEQPQAEEEAEHSQELPAPPSEETAEGLEFESGFATIWLHRTLPDPTPPAKRLTPRFARQLWLAAERAQVDWAFVLGVLRAERHLGRVPASQAALGQLSRQVAASLRATKDAWKTALAMRGRPTFADRVMAWTRYHRAVGLRALVTGLKTAESSLQERVLFDPRIDMYAGGTSDVASGRIDVRVLVLLRYMAEAHGQVTVSSLKSGHRFFARPGVPSAHMYGLAVDISGLEGRSITGNQAPGGLTERAVRNILLLPAELRPKQVISLLGLGGPSFPLEDHYDHIHVGY
jgi:hypothetical protein